MKAEKKLHSKYKEDKLLPFMPHTGKLKSLVSGLKWLSAVTILAV